MNNGDCSGLVEGVGHDRSHGQTRGSAQGEEG